ncbi:MAG: hemerythrin family protein [Anaeromyxobacteraceae bacterium]
MKVHWTPKLAIGVPVLDDQHRELFRRVAALLSAMADRHGGMHVRQTFQFLDRYVEEHFRDEAKLMRESGYPHLAAHETSHARFVAELRRLETLLEEDGTAARSTVAVHAGGLLCDWLRAHIASSDLDFAHYLAAREQAAGVQRAGTA